MKFRMAPSFLPILILTVALGCERAPAPPPSASGKSQADAAATAAAAVPTTQELLSGAYKTLPLPGMPLTVSVPESWKIESATIEPTPATPGRTIHFLEGPTPAYRMAINLAKQGVRAESPEIFFNALKAVAKGPDDRVELRDLGSARRLERFMIEAPTSNPKLDERGDPVLDKEGKLEMVTSTPIRWTITVFVPVGKSFERYELSFLGLTSEQYAIDKELLDKVVASLKYDQTVAPAAERDPLTDALP